MKRLLRARLRAVRDAYGRGADRGSGAIALLIFALLFVTLAAFVVDGGRVLATRERAADLAEQAARAAAQDIDVDALRSGADLGKTAPIRYGNCRSDITKFLTAAGLSDDDVSHSTCSGNRRRITVTVRITFQPMVTSLFAVKGHAVKGTATAEALTQ
ncbi:pilus assembly protein TadG-related protein [Streptomyces sp. NRRL F-5123]|uniref:pilus assembly protein TadG-related protein n=1 Tax=Streptomyces sp. NRRL F-5123 TaxID=1463856 RepID=UPI0004E17230|nr:pilus assembly protein TadG-related protein [Streptomyces sp. NRRL F-5123]